MILSAIFVVAALRIHGAGGLVICPLTFVFVIETQRGLDRCYIVRSMSGTSRNDGGPLNAGDRYL